MTGDIFSIHKTLAAAFQRAAEPFHAGDVPVIIEKPRDRSHGDLSSPIAMTLAKRVKKPPMAVAQELLQNLKFDPALVDRAEPAAPGFINLRLNPGVYYAGLEETLAQNELYGKNKQALGQRLLLEFVSANPTGPLNVVSARAAALGDSIANLLAASGVEVFREYYVNDAGNQARLFGESLEAAISRVKGVPKNAPEGGYQGAYMEDLAKAFLSENKGPLDPDFNKACRELGEWGMDRVVQWHRESLAKYGVAFDGWFSERRELHENGIVDRTAEALKSKGLTFESEGALWLRTSAYDAPKDEVLVKSNGQPAYFIGDIAYHLHKLGRGWPKVVNIMGPDHHGHILRMKAAHKALGYDPGMFEVLVAQQVNLLEGDEKVKMSKREGKFVTMDELIEKVGRDAARFFFVMRGANSHLDFDIEVAKKQTDENPVYYVQYAHARICSLLKKCADNGLTPREKASDFKLLHEPEALLLLKEIMEYPQWVLDGGRTYEPHRVVVYLQNLAASFHLFYSKHRILDAAPDVAGARLGLALGVKNVIRNALKLLGVSAPEQM